MLGCRRSSTWCLSVVVFLLQFGARAPDFRHPQRLGQRRRCVRGAAAQLLPPVRHRLPARGDDYPDRHPGDRGQRRGPGPAAQHPRGLGLPRADLGSAGRYSWLFLASSAVGGLRLLPGINRLAAAPASRRPASVARVINGHRPVRLDLDPAHSPKIRPRTVPDLGGCWAAGPDRVADRDPPGAGQDRPSHELRTGRTGGEQLGGVPDASSRWSGAVEGGAKSERSAPNCSKETPPASTRLNRSADSPSITWVLPDVCTAPSRIAPGVSGASGKRRLASARAGEPYPGRRWP